MSLVAYGINHESAPITIREKVAFDPKTLPQTLRALTSQEPITEAIILSTCNRTEIYANLSSYFPLQQWLQQQKGLTNIDLSAFDYAHHDIDAIRHLMRVASGLDSMILGEPQVFGQIKQAYQTACEAGTVGSLFHQLLPAVFETSKHIRTHTQICLHPVSLAYAVTQLSKQLFNTLDTCCAMLIGSGEMTELVATHLHKQSIQKLYLANRTIEKNQALADSLQAHNLPIGQVPERLHEVDIVVSATRSQLPIIGKGMLETVLKKRQRPLLLIDLAVPRDIEAEASELQYIHLYNIDDLQKTITANLQNRREAAAQAETIIESRATAFLEQLQIHQAREIITDFRAHLESLSEETLGKAITQLQSGHDPQIVLEQFARSLTNKILHLPTVKLREAASTAQTETLKAAKQLFEIN